MSNCDCPSCSERRWPAVARTAHLTHLRIYKQDGYWTVELHVGGELRESYVGETTFQEAAQRGLSWIRAHEAARQ